ncbi:hypothetical protein LZ012_10765 [Dechloromonas sp. XY25]|uniref:Uncharacterized protein n=1 Tax=Dechloromonas hankyongensis TaxID=2908002 RepID=A0ABS9K341_9RHOO|nr:hypothetical protein [Dechloromonas hankyongensis]MCG2577475.1 hypothetical protein [Dechloromonas hankyongensis]
MKQELGNRRSGSKGAESLMALLPTLTVPAGLALVEILSRQRLLFACLAQGSGKNLVLFGLAIAIIAILAVQQRAGLWLIKRYPR